jgi:hypothetical protein
MEAASKYWALFHIPNIECRTKTFFQIKWKINDQNDFKTKEVDHQNVVVCAVLWQDIVGVGESLCCVHISFIFPQSISNLMHCTLHLILNQLPFKR